MEHFRLIVEIVGGLILLFGVIRPAVKFIKYVRDGLLAILHDRIYQACNFYLYKQGWVDVQGLRNLEYMYRPYSAMGGNGTAKELYERVKNLPIEEE
ncbi:MAG: hypothetical protein EUB_03418 [Eubacterium sp.]|uniref:hypothetical protein n=1 Tax=Eubacterium sp. TaxID=142586 RepID=UPI00301F0654